MPLMFNLPQIANAVVKKSVLPVFVNSLPKDHHMLKGQGKISRREALIFFPRDYKEKMQ